MSNCGSALISSVQFPVLRVTDNFSATDVLTWISETVQLINAYPTLHRSSRILQQGVHKDARRALTIMLTRPGKTPPDWDYPADLELNVGFDVDKLDKVKSFELKWLELLRQQVATDTTETILEGLAAVALPRLVLTTAIVLSYIGKVSQYIESVDPAALSAIASKQVSSALMRSWWPDLRHLLENSGNPTTDTWDAILSRLAAFVAQAEQARIIIQACSPPPRKPLPSTPTPPFKRHQPDSGSTPVPASEGTTAGTAGADAAPSSSDTDITLTCTDCSNPFVWSVKDQAFYARKGFQQPKRCKSCNTARKADEPSAPAPTNAPGSSPTRPLPTTAHTRMMLVHDKKK